MRTWVLLLRAVNLGGHNTVSMPALRSALGEAGLADVRTYLQSGNVVARSNHRSPATVAGVVRSVVADTFHLDVPVIVRDGPRLRAVVAANPFPDAASDRPKLLHVYFLAGAPGAAAAELDEDPLARDSCRVDGDTLYVDYHDGVHTSRLTSAYLARRLGVDGTARNWRTVLALTKIVGDAEADRQ